MLRVVSHPLGDLPPLMPRAAEWRPDLNAALVIAPGTDEARARLNAPGALVVTTGQQPGLFTGPLYTMHKAFAAAALARALERRWQRPVVPLFWIAGDDHDYAEASTASWVDTAGALVNWRLPPRPASAPQRSMAEEHLPPEVLAGLQLLEAALPPGPPRDDTVAWLRRHYVPGATFNAAFAGAVAEFLAPFGIGCFDPTHIAAKQAQAPFIRTALRRAAELDTALADLPDAGTGIAAGEGATLVFLATDVGRDRLLIDGDGFRGRRSGERFTLSEVESLLDREAQRASRQTSSFGRSSRVRSFPPWPTSLVPARCAISSTRHRHSIRSLACHNRRRSLAGRARSSCAGPNGCSAGCVSPLIRCSMMTARSPVPFLEHDFPGDARQAIDALRKQVTRSAGVIAAAGKRVDPVLDRAMSGRMQRLSQLTDDIENVIRRHLRRRDDIAYGQFVRLRQSLQPDGKPQERVITAPSLLGRYGSAWSDAVVEAVSGWAESVPTGDS